MDKFQFMLSCPYHNVPDAVEEFFPAMEYSTRRRGIPLGHSS